MTPCLTPRLRALVQSARAYWYFPPRSLAHLIQPVHLYIFLFISLCNLIPSAHHKPPCPLPNPSHKRSKSSAYTCAKRQAHLRASGKFHLIPLATSANTFPDRQFILASYPTLKASNPDLKVLIREARGVEPRVFARFGTLLPFPLFFPVLRSFRRARPGSTDVSNGPLERGGGEEGWGARFARVEHRKGDERCCTGRRYGMSVPHYKLHVGNVGRPYVRPRCIPTDQCNSTITPTDPHSRKCLSTDHNTSHQQTAQ